MILLGLDFETTGLSAETDRIIEVGAVLWSTEEKKPWAMLSEMTWEADYPDLRQEITDITGIKQEALHTFGKKPSFVWQDLHTLVMHADAVVAHNGTRFDRLFWDAELKRQGCDPAQWQRPWLDTSVDVPYPDQIKTRKLVHLAAEHGFVNPFAHRALFDVLTMLTVLSQYDIEKVLRLSQEPNVTLVAQTEKPWHDQGRSTDLAKARGYRWDGVLKEWLKVVKKSQVEKEKTHGEFPVVEQTA